MTIRENKLNTISFFYLLLLLALIGCQSSPIVYRTTKKNGSADGLYLIYQTPDTQFELNSDYESHIDLVDNNGRVVHRWKIVCPVMNAKLYSNFEIGVACYTQESKRYPVGSFGNFRVLDKNSKVLWDYTNHSIHHDFERIDKDNFLFISNRELSSSEKKELKVPSNLISTPVFIDQILKVNLENRSTIVWDSLKYLSKYSFSSFQIPTDITHLNSVKFYKDNIINGNSVIVLTSRGLNQVLIVDFESQSVIWNSPTQVASKPHDASLIDGKKILFFNNGGDSGFLYSSNLKEIDLKTGFIKTIGPEGSSFLVHVKGGVQLLSNGHYLVTHSTLGIGFEVDENFNMYSSIHNNAIDGKSKLQRWWPSSPVFKIIKYSQENETVENRP